MEACSTHSHEQFGMRLQCTSITFSSNRANISPDTSASQAITPVHSKYSRLWRELLHLTAWGQLGVLLRYYVGRTLGATCSSDSRGMRCVTSPGLSHPGGALFLDLPANIVGCFIMGLLSSSDLLLTGHGVPPVTVHADGHMRGVAAHAVQAPVINSATVAPMLAPGIPCAALPAHSALQHHTPLHLGLRTGLCGCLTTFASWMSQMVVMLVGISSTAGAAHSQPVQVITGLIVGCLTAQAALGVGQQAARMAAGYWYQRQHRAAYIEAMRQLETLGRASVELQLVAGPGAMHLTDERETGEQTSALEKEDMQPTIPSHYAGANSTKRFLLAVSLCDAIAALVLLLLTVMSVAYVGAAVHAVHTGQHTSTAQRDVTLWLSILLGPIGCLLRWQMASWNQRAPSSCWSWYPLGTWTANITACLLDYAMLSIQLRTHPIAKLQANLIAAVMTGIGGSLSTVSTWVVELQKLGHQMPGNSRALLYWLLSVVPAILVGVLVYGTVAWTV